MTNVVALAGQKGGTGKSMLSQAFAVERARSGEKVVLVDLDIGQQTSVEWGEARKVNGSTPLIEVVGIDPDRTSDFGLHQMGTGFDVLVIDAPGFSDERTLLLAGFSDLMVLPTGASVADLRPTIRLMHELRNKGINDDRMVAALCRVKTAGEMKFARDYLAEGGFKSLPEALREMPTFRQLQNVGDVVTDAKGNMGKEAAAMIGGMTARLERVRESETAQLFVATPERFKAKDGGRD